MKKTLLAVFLALTNLLCVMPMSAAESEHVYPTPIKEVYVNTELDNYQLPYNLILPVDYDESKSYPVILLLHGAGERGTNNESQMFHVVDELYTTDLERMEQTIVIVPQCPMGEQWVNWPWANGSYSTDEIAESNALATAIKLLCELLDEYACDRDRVYLMGISMGGYGAWDALVRHEELFAAGVPLCGGADPSKADILKEIPIWTAHGLADNVVRPAGTEEIVNAIKDAGGERIKYSPIEDGEHNIWDTMTTDIALLDWLFEQNLTLRYPHPEPETDTTAPESTEPESTDTEPVSSGEDEESGAPIGIIVAAVATVAVIGGVIAVVAKKKK